MSQPFSRSNVSQEFEQALRGMMNVRVFPAGAPLFRQGTAAAGIYFLEEGAVRVLLSSGDHQGQLLDTIKAGSIVGLSDSLVGSRYRVTVEAEVQTTAGFVEREMFLKLLSGHHEYCMQVVRLLSDSLHGLYHKFRLVSAHPGRPRRRPLEDQFN